MSLCGGSEGWRVKGGEAGRPSDNHADADLSAQTHNRAWCVETHWQTRESVQASEHGCNQLLGLSCIMKHAMAETEEVTALWWITYVVCSCNITCSLCPCCCNCEHTRAGLYSIISSYLAYYLLRTAENVRYKRDGGRSGEQDCHLRAWVPPRRHNANTNNSVHTHIHTHFRDKYVTVSKRRVTQ